MSETDRGDAAAAAAAFSWKAFAQALSTEILTSSVKVRGDLFKNKVTAAIETHAMEDKELVGLVVVLKSTIGLYEDKASRHAVLDVLRKLSAKKPHVFVKAIAAILDPTVESAQPKKIAHPDAIATTVAYRYSLLSWVDLAITVPFSQLDVDPKAIAADGAWKKLVLMAARLLWGIALPLPSVRGSKATSIAGSAHRDVWRTIRAHPQMVEPMLTVLTAESTSAEVAVLLGNVVSTTVRLRDKDGAMRQMAPFKDAIVSYIDRVLLGSKTLVTYSSVSDMRDFLQLCVGSEFEALFKPSISKMLVRSPEAALPTCLWLLQALDKEQYDMTNIYIDVFAEPLASNLLKSSNANVRQYAADMFTYLANVPKTSESAKAAAEIATGPLVRGSYTQPEHRALFYALLGNVRSGIADRSWASSVAILAALVKMTAKETQEAPVHALFKAIGEHVGVIIKHLAANGSSSSGYKECEEALRDFSDAAKTGLALPERSAVVRRGWAADAVGEPLWAIFGALEDSSAKYPWMVAYVHPLVALLAKTAEKATANPLSASGGTLEAHVGVALALRCTLSNEQAADVDGTKLMNAVVGTEKSLVLWDKVFHKCTGLRESTWVLRCARILFARGCDDPRLASLLLWVACHSPEPSRQIVLAATDAAAEMSQADAVRLWKLVEHPLFAEMTTSLHGPNALYKWTTILGAAAAGIVAKDADPKIKAHTLVAMAKVAHHPAVLRECGKNSLWVALIQRASVDPGELCHEHLSVLKQCVIQALGADAITAKEEETEAALNLVKDLVFIGGESVTLRLLEYAHSDIDPAEIASITSDEIAVWMTPADQLCFDPIEAKKRTQGTARSSKTKDELWAEKLQEEIARKKNIVRKLSKEDQELVDRQREKEADMRSHVTRVHGGLCRGLAIVRAVVGGSASVASASMLVLVRIVVERAIIGCGGANVTRTLAGPEIVATLVAMVKVADGLDYDMRMPVTMGLLRARGFESVVPENWMQESMESLASRVYYRLRVNCETAPLPPAGFNFLLPFMQATAEIGGWGQKVKGGVEEHDEYAQMDSASEQLSMVVALLSFHAHFGNIEAMPRKEMLELMILVMATQPILLAICRDSMAKMAEEMEGTDTPLERDALLDGLVQSDSAVHGACLQALDYADLTELDYSAKLWVNVGGKGSEAVALEQNAELAQALWADNGMEALPGLVADIVPLLGNKADEIRSCAARSITLAIREARELAEQDDAELSTDDVQDMVSIALKELMAAYRKWHVPLEPEYDAFGIVVPGTQNRVDVAEPRVAVADALFHLASELATADQVESLIQFLVEDGVLGERAESVRTHMLSAGAQAVATHGANWSARLMPILERFLSKKDRGTASYDLIREGVVVLLGRLAQHLPSGSRDNDARVADAVDRLVATLSTPSEAVQSAVSECLPPLAKRIDEEKYTALMDTVMDRTLNGAKYSERRGGAYGLAGLVRGRGLAALKKFGVIDRLRLASEDKQASKAQQRQGALFAYETLATTVGRLFEPYVIQFIPQLLELFGDGNPGVRDAALDTARAIMSSISGHGVKLVLPSALAGLDSDQWRTKKGSVEMLGSMAFCAPKQLSISLPRVVPSIIEALTDTHGQVSAAARQALLRFGDVIHNPEIQAIVPSILAALDDPAGSTDAALRTLLYTAFVHYVDAPSLALVVPVLERGMRERNASTKRNAAQIMGSMATLTDPKDLAPYLGSLVPLVRSVLVDPVPEARATAAKALGSLVQRLGEEQFPSLVADLIKVLKGDDASGVDRAGAAQGLSEVLAGVGVARLEGLLPEVVANCSSAAARVPVREGFMTLLIYLPTTFGDEFQRFLPQVITPIVTGLADENEQVRGAALRAGRILVVSYSLAATDVILPELLSALANDLWRIRMSSIELLGEFLYRVAGITGKQAERDREAARALFFAAQGDDEGDAEDDAVDEAGGTEDDNEAEEEAAISSNLREVLNEKLGADRCQAVLAALYVARNDVSAMVRQASFTVWKSIVHNTPRTVRECLSSIMEIVLVGLASADYDRRTAAARTLGDLVHKLGEAVMSRVVPILKKALSASPSGDSDGSVRHGVFVGLAEILHSTGRAYVDDYADAMVPLVRRGLCDEDATVREAAAAAFNALQQSVGPRAVDAVVPPLLNALTQRRGAEGSDDDELAGIDAGHALEALRELMAVRANAVFPVLIPTLTALPVSAFNARALASLIQVSGGGGALSKRLPHILAAIFESLPVHHAAGDSEAEEALRETVRVVVASAAHDEATLETLMLKFHEMVKVGEGVDLAASVKDASRVAEACFAMEALCKAFGPNSAGRGRSVLGGHVADWLRILIDLLAVPSPHVVRAAWAALDALCRTVPKEDYDGYVGPVSRAVQRATESLPQNQPTMPGFNLPKGIGPLLPIYSQGLLTGTPDTKERAVRGMARLVQFTDPSALRLFATNITGPLIRIVGDRNPPNVKAAILSTLGLLLTQVPALMRPFLPQLQRTFVRALSEQDDIVRQRAAAALTSLIPLQARLDPLVAELTGGMKQQATDDAGMRIAMMKAVCAVFNAPGAKALSPASVQTLEAMVLGRNEFVALSSAAANSDYRWRSLRSKAFGGLCSILPDDAAAKLVVQHAIADASDSGPVQGVKLEFLAAVLVQAPVLVANSPSLQQKIGDCVDTALTPSGDIGQAQAALQATGVAKNALLLDGTNAILPKDSPIAPRLCQALVRAVASGQSTSAFDSDVQQSALSALKALAKNRYNDVIEPVRDSVVQAAMAHVRDRNITVKLAAERCVLYALRLARVPASGFEGSQDGLNSYVANVGGPESDKGKTVLDYHRRVMSKLADATRELDYVSDDDEDEGTADADI